MSKYNQNSLCKRSGRITIQFFVNASCSNRCQMCWAGELVKAKGQIFWIWTSQSPVKYAKIEVVLAGKPFNFWSKGLKFVLHDLLQYKWWNVKKDLSQDLQPDATFPKNEETLVCICLATKGLSLLFIFEEWKYSFLNQLSFAASCIYTFYGHFRDFDSGEYHHRFRRGAAESKPNMKLDKRPARKSPLGASWGLRCSQIYILFSRALVTSWSSKPQWKEKTKIFTLCLSLICKFSLFLKIIKPFYVAKQMTKGFP